MMRRLLTLLMKMRRRRADRAGRTQRDAYFEDPIAIEDDYRRLKGPTG